MKHPLFWSEPASKRFQVDTGWTLTTGLVAYYKMEDSTDFWGTYSGTASNVTFSAGKVNNGANFSGSSYTKIELPSSLQSLTSSWTYNFWIKTTQSSQGTIFSRYAGSSAQRQIFIYINSWIIRIAVPYVADNIITTISSINDWNYHLITFTKSWTTWKSYVDSVLKSTVTNSTPQELNTSVAKIWADSLSETSWLLTGQLDEFCIWQKALTQNEITDLYNAGAGQTMIS